MILVVALPFSSIADSVTTKASATATTSTEGATGGSERNKYTGGLNCGIYFFAKYDYLWFLCVSDEINFILGEELVI